ncbi:MAG: hypothetical protein Alis3KO_15260 [Aliiglaciecola sp.]|uniref:hypothetical protein n=1 Tax=Aliiglaciecola sp. M165 TaxID=2593649 RepID=UPI00163DE46C|nr:hypothetical protein [Aliiglaciecola sp. M165]
MFSQIHLITLIFAPVMAYLAAALIFSLVESKKGGHAFSANTSSNTANIRYHDGHSPQ